MKTIKSKFFALAFVALGVTAGITSCGKDDEKKSYSSENINGAFEGTHKLQIPATILNGLTAALPEDPETGEKPDLTKGFEDTLTLNIVDGKVRVYSYLLDLTIDGELVGDNKFVIKETKYDKIQLGTVVEATNASIATAEPVTISSNANNTKVNVKLILKARSVAGFSLGSDLTIPTAADFTKNDNLEL